MPVSEAPITGRKTVGTSAVALTTDATIAGAGVIIYADAANTDVIYVGDSAAVTADADDATDGFPIPAGSSLTLSLNHARLLFVIGGAASQKLWWMIL